MSFTLIYIYLEGFYFVTTVIKSLIFRWFIPVVCENIVLDTAIKVCSDDELVWGAPK